MRRLFVAVFAALLVVIGLSVVSVGTATAATPLRSENASCPAFRVALQVARDLPVGTGTGQVSQQERQRRINDAERDLRNNNCDGYNGGGNGHNNGGGYGNGNGYGLPRYNSCSDYNRNGIRDIRRGDLRYNQSWDRNNNGIACDTGDVIVSSDGNCVTYMTARDNIRNYTNDYNRLRGVYNGDFNRLSRSDRDNLNRLYSLSNRYSNDWNTNLSRLRTVCQDNTPPVVVINQAPAAAVTVTQSAPAPVYSAPAPSGVSSGSIPSGSVNTGGNSVAFTVAHNRAI